MTTTGSNVNVDLLLHFQHLLSCSLSHQLARYFCTGAVEDESEFTHFALNVPRYTHFTSPIRRYADIIVHRQLAHALGIQHGLLHT